MSTRKLLAYVAILAATVAISSAVGQGVASLIAHELGWV